jgi:hypothetical protein
VGVRAGTSLHLTVTTKPDHDHDRNGRVMRRVRDIMITASHDQTCLVNGIVNGTIAVNDDRTSHLHPCTLFELLYSKPFNVKVDIF